MLAAEGYAAPTPIQAQSIPHILTGRDLLGLAQTGTGKTAAFALPILHQLAAQKQRAGRRSCRVLVLAPTRELASQIAESFRVYGRGLRLSVTVVFGGVGAQPQVRAMAGGVDILVATPGRLLDHMDQGNIALNSVEFLVLDEVDRMLDMGFIAPVRRIVRAAPKQRQTLLFSATLPSEIRALAAEMLDDPVEVTVTPASTTVEKVDQRVIHVPQRDKPALLASLMGDAAITRALVFTRTKRGADRVTRHLETAGVGAAAIHGNKSQGQREQALARFRSGRARVLVATDIAARGIDVDGVSHVINFELPNIPESYVHRIGRTGRAGASGIAISFCDADERPYLKDIETLIRRRLAVHNHLHSHCGTVVMEPVRAGEPVPASPRAASPHAASPRVASYGGRAAAPAAGARTPNGNGKANGKGKRPAQAQPGRSASEPPASGKPSGKPSDGPANRQAKAGQKPRKTGSPARQAQGQQAAANPQRGGNASPRPAAQKPATAPSRPPLSGAIAAELSQLSFLAPPRQKQRSHASGSGHTDAASSR